MRRTVRMVTLLESDGVDIGTAIETQSFAMADRGGYLEAVDEVPESR
jgi:hypothetical protein